MSKKIAKFLIASYGHAASMWIAKSLSSLPGVLCSHGPASLDFSLNFSKSDYDYSEEEKKLRRETVFERKPKFTKKEIFDELESKGGSRAIGNIHWYTHQELALTLSMSDYFFCPLRVHSVVRHPISRIVPDNESSDYPVSSSFMSHLRLRQEFLLTNSNLIRRFDVDFTEIDFDEPAEVQRGHSKLLALASIVEEILILRDLRRYFYVKPVAMEALTANPIVFSSFASFLTRSDYIDTLESVNTNVDFKVFNADPGKQAMHDPFYPVERFENWPDWQKTLTLKVLEHYRFYDHYKYLGYNFCFR